MYTIWAASWQNQQNDLWAQWRLRTAWVSTQYDQSSLCTQWVAKDPSFLHADSEDSDQTGRMPRLIWVFAGRTCHFVGFVMRWLILQSGQWLPGQNISRAKEYHVKRTGKSLEHVDQCESNQGHYFPRQGSINIATSLLALYLYIYTCIVHIRFVFVCYVV